MRDLLLGLEPKDFDIATNATPEQIKALFRNCRLIGRRFRLAHIVFGRDIIEVATFRGHHDAKEKVAKDTKTSKQSEHGMLLRDNIYGSIEEDAERRDFTINALYYSTRDFKVYDYADGVSDIKQGLIRLIGDPETRYREDPVRMLRAVRFATKLDMSIERNTAAPIKNLSGLLANIPPARMFEEFLKLFMSGKALANVNMLREYELFHHLFPITSMHLDNAQTDTAQRFIELALTNTDIRINTNQRVTPAFLLAALLWHPLEKRAQHLQQNAKLAPQDAFFAAMSEIFSEQSRSIAIPKRFQIPMKDIWMLQHKLTRRDGNRAYKLLTHPKFRAGFDFLLIRGEIEGGELADLAKWWQEFQHAPESQQQKMVQLIKPSASARRRTPRKRRKPNTKKSNIVE